MAGNIVFRTMNRIHIFVYRVSGGRILGSVVGSPVLLLTTTGRKTNKPRTRPLVYAFDGETYAVIASDEPAWHRNLQSNPQATIEVRKQTYRVTARDANAEEAKEWWELLVGQSPAFQSFQDNPHHVIVLLKPEKS